MKKSLLVLFATLAGISNAEARNLCSDVASQIQSDEVVVERYLTSSANGLNCPSGVGLVVENAQDNMIVCAGYDLPDGFTGANPHYQFKCQHYTAQQNALFIYQNSPPDGKVQSLELSVNQVYTTNIGLSDPDGDALTYSASDNSLEGGQIQLDQSTGDYTYTPKLDYAGTDWFSIYADDGKGGVTLSQVFIAVGLPVEQLVIEDILYEVNQGESVNLIVKVLNEDSMNYTYSLQSNTTAQNGSIVPFTPEGLNRQDVFTYTPDPEFSGEDTFTVTVDDGTGRVSTGALRLNVIPADTNVVQADYTQITAVMSVVQSLLLDDE